MMKAIKAITLIALLIIPLVASGCDEKEVLTVAATFSPSPTPPIPRTIGIQAGHVQNAKGQYDPGAELPEVHHTDSVYDEASLNLAIASKVVELLKRMDGYQVDLFTGKDPALKGYKGDAFVAIHADQAAEGASGYKVARRGGEKGSGLDGSGDDSDRLVQSLWEEYGYTTGLPRNRFPNHFTNSMLDYYGLRWIDPATPGAIIEVGWMEEDVDVLIGEQGKVALGIAGGIVKFLGDDVEQLSSVVAAPAEPDPPSEQSGEVIQATVASSPPASSVCPIDPDVINFCEIGEIIRLGEVWGDTQTGFDDVAMVVTGWDVLVGDEWWLEENESLGRVDLLLFNEGGYPAMMAAAYDRFFLEDGAGVQYRREAPGGQYAGHGTTNGILRPSEQVRASEYFVISSDSTDLKFVYVGGAKVIVDLGTSPITVEPPALASPGRPQPSHQVGDVVEIPAIDIALTVNDVSFPSSLDLDHVTVPSGERIVAVNATLMNKGSEIFGEQTFVEPFELKDADGWRYTPIWESATSGQYFPGPIQPRERATGQIFFSVPENAGDLKFVVQAFHSQALAREFVSLP